MAKPFGAVVAGAARFNCNGVGKRTLLQSEQTNIVEKCAVFHRWPEREHDGPRFASFSQPAWLSGHV